MHIYSMSFKISVDKSLSIRLVDNKSNECINNIASSKSKTFVFKNNQDWWQEKPSNNCMLNAKQAKCQLSDSVLPV